MHTFHCMLNFSIHITPHSKKWFARKVTQDKTLLMVEHDMSVVFGLADRIAVVVYGEVLACDTPQAIRQNTKVQEAYLGGHAPVEVQE